MKKIALFILAVIALCSCSKDDMATDTTPADGQYVAETTDFLACMVLENGKCIYFAPFVSGEVLSSWRDVSTSGGYPNYVYRVDELTITAEFESSTTFNAVLNGGLSVTGNGETHLAFENAPIQFKLDNRVLDANGDGILDEMQSEIK